MRLLLLACCIGAAIAQEEFTESESNNRGLRYSPQVESQNQIQVNQYYRAPASSESEEDSAPQQTVSYRRPYDDNAVKSQSRKGQFNQNTKDGKQQLEEEEEIEEPDRLSVLLPSSTFTCQGRVTGYYADEGLGCEVFHYCQDMAKHSWICPEGFSFHQVHLICMPPSSDNICAESSQYTFVNDFLYKPVNQEEVDGSPNITLKYADRYYPENVHAGGSNSDRSHQRESSRHPIQVGLPARRQPAQAQHQQQAQPLPYRHQPQVSQVFRSSEEVNIPLQQRRPGSQTGRPEYVTPASSYEEQDFQYEA